ncbi:MAG: hypothetical protein JWM27_807 [Gemmatimonadetes bacterium]|nr:hypothetical protein [Gemmatimonadota bacterium]
MTAQGIRYTVSVTLVAALVAAIAALSSGPAGRWGVLVGVGLGWMVQVASFWVFLVWLYPGRAWIGYGLGLLARFAIFALVAFLVVPRAALPFGPTLFSLVAVFWLTTMLEPAFLKPRSPRTVQG